MGGQTGAVGKTVPQVEWRLDVGTWYTTDPLKEWVQRTGINTGNPGYDLPSQAAREQAEYYQSNINPGVFQQEYPTHSVTHNLKAEGYRFTLAIGYRKNEVDIVFDSHMNPEGVERVVECMMQGRAFQNIQSNFWEGVRKIVDLLTTCSFDVHQSCRDEIDKHIMVNKITSEADAQALGSKVT